jgi:hypothetical protein
MVVARQPVTERRRAAVPTGANIRRLYCIGSSGQVSVGHTELAAMDVFDGCVNLIRLTQPAPGPFRKLDAVAVLTGPLLPAPGPAVFLNRSAA